MKKTVTVQVQTEIAQPVTKPGYLVEIAFSTPLRLSSRGDINWNGGVFITWGFDVQIDVDATRSALAGSVVLNNTENALGTLVLLEGVADRQIKVWQIYGDAPGLYDVVPHFFGSCDEASIDPTNGRVSISVMQSGGVTLYAPRTYITREAGFNFLPAAGTIIPWGGEQYRLEGE